MHYPRVLRPTGFLGPLRLAALCLSAAALLPAGWAPAAERDSVPFRAVFCDQVFAGVNESDAKAAIKAWANSLTRNMSIEVIPDPQVVAGMAGIRTALHDGTCDYASLPTDDYFRLEPALRSTSVCISVVDGTATEEYVLLVSAQSGAASAADLAGRSLIVYDNIRAALAFPWLERLLADGGLPAAEDHFGSITKAVKLPKVVLPVFFRQGDACIVTRRGFETMVELNPQVGRELKVLAVSPPLVPSVAFFRPGYDSPARREIESEITRLDLTAAGRQVMNHFQCDAIEIRPVAILDGTRDFLLGRARQEPGGSASAGSGSAGGSVGGAP